MIRVCLKDSNGEWELMSLPDKYYPPAIRKYRMRPLTDTFSLPSNLYEVRCDPVIFNRTNDFYDGYNFLPIYLANEPVFNLEKR